jgi:hypothetical protein
MSIPFPPEPLANLAREIAAILKTRKESVSVAETAAGGLISAHCFRSMERRRSTKVGVIIPLVLVLRYPNLLGSLEHRRFDGRSFWFLSTCHSLIPYCRSSDLHTRVPCTIRWMDPDRYRQLQRSSPQIVSRLAENVREKLGSTYCVCEVGERLRYLGLRRRGG